MKDGGRLDPGPAIPSPTRLRKSQQINPLLHHGVRGSTELSALLTKTAKGANVPSGNSSPRLSVEKGQGVTVT